MKLNQTEVMHGSLDDPAKQVPRVKTELKELNSSIELFPGAFFHEFPL